MEKRYVLTVFAALLCTACAFPAGTMSSLGLSGDSAPLSAATRTILITPQTAYVNIEGGEVVKFIAGDKSFAWKFDGPSEGYRFDLKESAPPGALDHRVVAYVDADPRYMGGR